jgi:hypothetical protein
METLIVDIINQNALKLLQDLELLQLIKVRREVKAEISNIELLKYKGAMKKQPIEQIEQQFIQIRQDW